MKIRRWTTSEHCFALLKIRMEYVWVEQLELLVQISGLKNIEELIKTLLAWKLLTEKDNIEKQRQQNIKEEKEAEEYWKWKLGDDF